MTGLIEGFFFFFWGGGGGGSLGVFFSFVGKPWGFFFFLGGGGGVEA